jgi:hypothetical protein
MNEFDHFIKRDLKVAYYIRYADDFVVLHEDKEYLERVLSEMSEFLQMRLKLSLHPDKVFIRTLASGVDFLGWIHFPRHRILRTSTKRRMLKKLAQKSTKEALASYSGLLRHGDTYRIRQLILEEKS